MITKKKGEAINPLLQGTDSYSHVLQCFYFAGDCRDYFPCDIYCWSSDEDYSVWFYISLWCLPTEWLEHSRFCHCHNRVSVQTLSHIGWINPTDIFTWGTWPKASHITAQVWGTNEYLVESGIISAISRRYVVNWSPHWQHVETAFFFLNDWQTFLVFEKSVKPWWLVAGDQPGHCWPSSANFVHITDISDPFFFPNFFSVISCWHSPSSVVDISPGTALQAPSQFPAYCIHIALYPSTNCWSLTDYSLTTSQMTMIVK